MTEAVYTHRGIEDLKKEIVKIEYSLTCISSHTHLVINNHNANGFLLYYRIPPNIQTPAGMHVYSSLS